MILKHKSNSTYVSGSRIHLGCCYFFKKKSFYRFATEEHVYGRLQNLNAYVNRKLKTILNSQVKLVQHLIFFTFKTEQVKSTAC